MIKKVEASFSNEKKQLNKQNGDVYKNEFKAPKEVGDFPVEVIAYDDAGNITLANSKNTSDMVVNVTKWSMPKTNWKETDRFNFQDYNRIKRNLEYLYEEANRTWSTFDMQDMGKDKNYEEYVYSDEFNKFEENLDTINDYIYTLDYGISQHFYDNGVFIQWRELNRIESAILKMKEILDLHKLTLRKLPFKLGRYREVRI